jgi:hypothetical protein
MDERYKPQDVNEISIILGLDCEDNHVGKYTDNSAALQTSCSAYLIDPQTGVWNDLGRFTGSEPPKSKKGGGSRSGSRPTDAILRKIGVPTKI